jgi:hypothetical protein
VSKRKRSYRGRPPAKKQKQQKKPLSPVIPIVVGVVVVAVIVGVIVAAQGQQSQTAGAAPVITAQPLSTGSLPYPNVPRISLQETTEKLEQGQAVLIDVRSQGSFDKAHASGALSIPEEEVIARLDEFPRDKELVLY